MVRFLRSPQAKLLKRNKYYLFKLYTSLGNTVLYLHKFFIDAILTYVSVENQLELGQIGISPLSKTLRRIMQHSTVRSIYIIWSWKDHLASGLIKVTNPTLNIKLKKKN